MALLEYSLDNMKTWNPLPSPTMDNYDPKYEHKEERYESANGTTCRDIIRKNKATITCGWNHLNGEQMAEIQSLYDENYLYLKFTDNFNNRVVKKVFVEPIDANAKYCNKATYELTMRTGVQAVFKEV